MPRNIHGKMVWIHPRARFSVTAQTFYKREPHVRNWLTERLKPGQVFLDIGAHHGWVSMWGLALVGNDGKVISFEPSPVNLDILEWHHARNKFSQWTIVPKAVSDKDSDEVEFFLVDTGDSPMNSLTTRGPGTPLMDGRDVGKTTIQTVTVDTYCAENYLNPNFLKIDVEGAELLVLRGAAKLLSQSSPVIILAMHPYWLPEGQSPLQIFELLVGYGYTIYDSKGSVAEHLNEGEYLCLSTGRGHVK